MLWESSLIPTVSDPQGSIRFSFVSLCLILVKLFFRSRGIMVSLVGVYGSLQLEVIFDWFVWCPVPCLSPLAYAQKKDGGVWRTQRETSRWKGRRLTSYFITPFLLSFELVYSIDNYISSILCIHFCLFVFIQLVKIFLQFFKMLCRFPMKQ